MCALALTFVTCSASVRPLPAQQSGRLREPRWRREPAPASTCQLLGLKVHAHGCSSMCALALTFVTCSCPPATCPTSCRLNHAVAASPLQPRPAGDQRLMLLIGLSSHCFRCRDTARRAGPNARRAQRRTTLAVNNAAILHPALRKAMPCACCTHAQEPCKGPPPLCDTRRAPCAAMRRLPLSPSYHSTPTRISTICDNRFFAAISSTCTRIHRWVKTIVFFSTAWCTQHAFLFSCNLLY